MTTSPGSALPEQRFAHLVRASAVYDILATAAFATPWSFALLHQGLAQLSPLPAFAPLHVLFANLLGSVVLVWSAARLLRPTPLMGLLDAVARGLFATWQLHYLLAMHGAAVVWPFTVFEVGFGLAQALGCWRLRSSITGSGTPPASG